MQIKTIYGMAELVFDYYYNGRTAILLRDVEDGSPIATLTVNIPEVLLDAGEFCVKNWSENESIARDCMASGLFVDTGKRFPTGRVKAPIWKMKEV